VLHRTVAQLPLTGRRVRVTKVMNARTGAFSTEAADARTGAAVDLAALRAVEERAHAAKYGKLHPLLYDELQRRAPFERIPVALWVHCEEQPVDKGKYLDRAPSRVVVARALTPFGVKMRTPSSGELPTSPPPQLVAYRRTVAEAKVRARRALEAIGVHVPRELITVPLLMTTATRQQIAAITRLDDVETIYLHSERWVQDLTDSLKVSRATNVHGVKGYKGAGVHVAIWEDSPEPVTHLAFAAYFDNKRRHKSSHARMVAAIIKNTHPSESNGYAPDCTLYAANSKILEALEWAVVTQECTVINESISEYWSSTQENLLLEDHVKDYLATHYPFPTIVQSAGNSSDPAHAGRYFVTHKGYNGIVVGNHDDTATGMSAHSIFRNPDSPHGDRELPDICANGTDVYVLDDTRSGTSFATPAVAGTVALLQSADRRLKSWPEACRAILYAAAHNVDGGTWFKDVDSGVDAKDGAGALDAFAAVKIAESLQKPGSTAAEHGWDAGTLTPMAFGSDGFSRFSYRVKVPASGARHVKVALAWNSRTTDTRDSKTVKRTRTSNLVHDLDVFIYEDGHMDVPVAFSASLGNSYEIAEFDAKAGKNYRIFIHREPTTTNENVWYGIAWMVHPRV